MMSADQLGCYMMSDQFIKRANTAVEKAVRRLEAKAIRPAYCESLSLSTVLASDLVVKVMAGKSSAKRRAVKIT